MQIPSAGPNPNPDFRVEAAIDGEDQIVAIKPPVDGVFRARIYDILDEMGLIKGIVVTGGNFFETKHLPDGETYSELRMARTALDAAGQRLMNIAQQAGGVLREQHPKKIIDVSPYLLPIGGSRELFDEAQ